MSVLINLRTYSVDLGLNDRFLIKALEKAKIPILRFGRENLILESELLKAIPILQEEMITERNLRATRSQEAAKRRKAIYAHGKSTMPAAPPVAPENN
jgi:hypothetical protein